MGGSKVQEGHVENKVTLGCIRPYLNINSKSDKYNLSHPN